LSLKHLTLLVIEISLVVVIDNLDLLNIIVGTYRLWSRPTLGIFFVFTRESSYCFQRVLAIAILSVCPSVCLCVCHTGGSVKNGAS